MSEHDAGASRFVPNPWGVVPNADGVFPPNPFGAPVDPADWPPILREALADPHPATHRVFNTPLMASRNKARFAYNTCICSVAFDEFDAGLPPFMSDLRDALLDADIQSAEGVYMECRNLRQLFVERDLWKNVVAYRHEGNLAYMERVNRRDKTSIWQHHRLS